MPRPSSPEIQNPKRRFPLAVLSLLFMNVTGASLARSRVPISGRPAESSRALRLEISDFDFSSKECFDSRSLLTVTCNRSAFGDSNVSSDFLAHLLERTPVSNWQLPLPHHIDRPEGDS